MQATKVFGVGWRSVVVSGGYVAGLIGAGMLSALVGAPVSGGSADLASFGLLALSGALLGLFLGSVAARLALGRWQQFALWFSVVFFNLGSVAIEGAYFVPGLVTVPIPALLLQQAFGAAGAASVITWLFAARARPISWLNSLRRRSWQGWVWRFAVSALSYVLFYYVFGALNYELVTRPYYSNHLGGLAAPTPSQVVVAELVRGPLIVLSAMLFILSTRLPRRRQMMATGLLLFAVGGIVPLVMQIGTLPPLLILASAGEILCQNVATGMVAARLLGLSGGERMDRVEGEAAIQVTTAVRRSNDEQQ